MLGPHDGRNADININLDHSRDFARRASCAIYFGPDAANRHKNRPNGCGQLCSCRACRLQRQAKACLHCYKVTMLPVCAGAEALLHDPSSFVCGLVPSSQ